MIKKKKAIQLLDNAGDDISVALDVAKKLNKMYLVKRKIIRQRKEDCYVEEFTFKCGHCNNTFKAEKVVEYGTVIAFPRMCICCAMKFDFSPFINKEKEEIANDYN